MKKFSDYPRIWILIGIVSSIGIFQTNPDELNNAGWGFWVFIFFLSYVIMKFITPFKSSVELVKKKSSKKIVKKKKR